MNLCGSDEINKTVTHSGSNRTHAYTVYCIVINILINIDINQLNEIGETKSSLNMLFESIDQLLSHFESQKTGRKVSRLDPRLDSCIFPIVSSNLFKDSSNMHIKFFFFTSKSEKCDTIPYTARYMNFVSPHVRNCATEVWKHPFKINV